MNTGIKGVGCDIVSISRISNLITEQKFLDKVYTSCEQKYIKEKPVHTAAGLWAAKEATSKALGTGFSGFTARDIEIKHNKDGKPYIILLNGAEKAAKVHNVKQIHISISHEKKQAIAFAVAERRCKFDKNVK